jgi:4-amino-4-deoxy-L-arabinose transferase-like glycosyltransferase
MLNIPERANRGPEPLSGPEPLPRQSAELIRIWNGLLLGALMMLVAGCLLAFRIEQSPDLFADEGLYTSTSNNLAAGRGLVENSGRPFIWHPPFYIIVGAGFLHVNGLTDGDPIKQILAMRAISVLAATLTVGLVFALGWRLHGIVTGAAAALLFTFDPYIQRINRRSMLEPLATALALLAITLYACSMERRRWVGLAVGSGVVFGLAGLTKEFLLVGPVVILAFAILFRQEQLGRASVIVFSCALVYACYPLWIIGNGLWVEYAGMKATQLYRMASRLIGAPPVRTSSTVTGPGLLENLVMTAEPYVWSYALIALGGLLIARICWGLRPGSGWHPSPLLLALALWAACNYVLVTVSLVFGRGSDQFFYYMIVPATLIVGWGLAVLLDRVRRQGTSLRSRAVAVVAALLLCAASVYNVNTYVRLFAVARDDSYVQLASHIRSTIPPGSTLVFGNDLANYIFPEYDVRFDRRPTDIEDRGTRYVVLSTKERWGGYNKVTPEFYDWVTRNGEPQFVYQGPTFWTTTLFELRSTE